MRYDLTTKTKNVVAGRAGFRCSNPSCRRVTSGPHSDANKIINIGVAVLITAASPEGPRYEPKLSSAERLSIENTIWLCHTCSRLIDYDSDKYPADLLLKWKETSEENAIAEISTFQDTNWPRDIKVTCAKLLEACDMATNKIEKGKTLEDLIEVLFTSDDGIILAAKRVSTGDEEIDLVCKNNVNRPFWMALQSPLCFVECKNWSTNVGTSEIRDFEIKLQNHRLAKVGFFVSMNGFTSAVISEMKRMGRSDYHLTLIERSDIVEYLSSDESLLNWLENKMSQLY